MPRRKRAPTAKAASRPGPLLIGLAYAGFVSLGLPDGLLSVAWPSIRTSFHLPLDALGLLLVLFTTGYLLSSFSSGRLLARLNVGTLLALSCLATAVSLLGYALAPRWEIMVAFGWLAGLGAGAIDAGLNTYVATHYSARTLNWLHACYGIGATGGPVIMANVVGANLPWQWGYGLVGMGQLGLAGCFSLTRQQWSKPQPRSRRTVAKRFRVASSLDTLQLPVMWFSVTAFFIYTGLEAATGIWVYSLFTEARAIPEMVAGMWVSAYWGGLTIGRLASGIVIGFVSVHLLLRLCIISMALGAALIWLDLSTLLSFLGLLVIGVAAAPIFPSLIATTPARLGAAHTANGIGFQVAAAVLGQSLLPSLIGVLAQALGLEIVGPVLLTAALLLLVVYEALLVISPCNR